MAAAVGFAAPAQSSFGALLEVVAFATSAKRVGHQFFAAKRAAGVAEPSGE